MEQYGYVSISVIVNRFCIDTCSVAKAFAMMQPSHILDSQMHQQTMNSGMFARSQILIWENFKAQVCEEIMAGA